MLKEKARKPIRWSDIDEIYEMTDDEINELPYIMAEHVLDGSEDDSSVAYDFLIYVEPDVFVLEHDNALYRIERQGYQYCRYVSLIRLIED